MPQAAKVGLFAAVVLAVLAIFILRIEDINLFAEAGQRVDAVFDSVAGLDNKSAVRVAGVRVGRVEAIGLEGRRARVTLLLETPVALTAGTRARVTTVGLLGDKYVELLPGPPGAPPLAAGALLEGETPVSVDQAIARFDEIGQNLQELTSSLAGAEAGDRVARLLENLDAISAEVRELVAGNREQVTATVANFEAASAALARELPRLADRLDALLVEVNATVAENRGQLTASLENVRELTAGLRPAVDDLRTISGRLAAGEGTIGKLLTSDETHDRLVTTLDSIQGGVDSLADTLGAVQKLQLDLGLEGFYLQDVEEGQASLHLDLETRSQWRYRLGIVSSAFGDEETRLQRITTTDPDGNAEVQVVETFTRDEEDLVFTGLLGLPFSGEARLWTGLIESSFGLQAEYPLFERRLWLSLEAFDFDRAEDLEPHLRLGGRWRFHPNLYLLLGYDDFLEDTRDSFFLGGGIRWRDDDLKYLLGSVPRF